MTVALSTISPEIQWRKRLLFHWVVSFLILQIVLAFSICDPVAVYNLSE